MVPCETCRRRRAQHVPYVVGLQAERAKMHRGPMAAAEAAKLLRRRSQAAVWVGCAGLAAGPFIAPPVAEQWGWVIGAG